MGFIILHRTKVFLGFFRFSSSKLCASSFSQQAGNPILLGLEVWLPLKRFGNEQHDAPTTDSNTNSRLCF
jgi:hypothetical protein